ncbi:hypothetical protein [Porphyromonas catoniae]|uniref:hypothetical protein n=1 Tax=Porphyromonas catoniae TaxID=41976 RepID=UPI0028D400E5|nr:hypothetical protein [Porphyromonas catoniae]
MERPITKALSIATSAAKMYVASLVNISTLQGTYRVRKHNICSATAGITSHLSDRHWAESQIAPPALEYPIHRTARI